MNNNLTPFHGLYLASLLFPFTIGKERLVAAYASADIEIYPYQVAAALFALRSPFLKGVVLADEGSLGKTYEALLVISQLYFEGKERILIVVPTPLLQQWTEILEIKFAIPYIIAADSFDFQGIVLTTYDHAVANADLVGAVEWNIAVFEEAHRLGKENKTTEILKEAVGDAFKLLLTATPILNSIMDLYGLISFIDETALTDSETFYKRYFRKPENYHELTATASRYCFRTLRSQVERYVKIPKRIPVTLDYSPTKDEQKLSVLLEKYLKKPVKQAFPKMDSYELTLMLTRTLSSSPQAFDKLLQGAIERVDEAELVEMHELAAKIKKTSKGQELLKAIKKSFSELKKRGANRKAVVFTENRTTQKYLADLLCEADYKVLTYDGSNSRDYEVIKNFRDDSEILVATDIASEGFNFEFCSLVVNYDFPYTTLIVEQRIMRCHRQGQQNDVIVLNFLSKSNFSDVRMLELVNKRVLQFDGILGRSDDIVGNFCEDVVDGVEKAFELSRHKRDIDAEFKAILDENKAANADDVHEAENALFTTFTRDVADKITVTPQYIKDKTAEITARLWQLTRWFFRNKEGFRLDDETKTIHVGVTSQKVFTGAAVRRREYSVADRTLSPVSSIAKNIVHETFWRGIPDCGTILAVSLEIPVEIGYYRGCGFVAEQLVEQNNLFCVCRQVRRQSFNRRRMPRDYGT
jgi:superfamily II DNA or RNA helicase